MKKIFIILILLLASSSIGFSQGNTLQFNQVLILNNGTTYTVPANKTWKVESAVYSDYYISYTNGCKTIINGTTVELVPFVFYDGNSYSRAPISTAFPMWLPEGTTIQPTQKTSKMFVIEFNVVPI